MDEVVVQEVEGLGFWGVLVPDMYVWDEDYYKVKPDENVDALLEPWIALSYLAAKTERVRIGTWVTPIPLRPPGILAKTVATLDNISGGRVILGVGAGATKRMFEGYAEWDDAMTRAEKTAEGLELIIKLWTEKEVNFRGRYYHAKNAVLEPKPLQKPHPPLLFGGAGRRMLRLAGRFADICYIPPWTDLPREAAIALVLTEARRFNREDKVSFAYSFEGPTTPEYDYRTYVEKVEEAEQKGCDYFMVPFNYGSERPWLLIGAADDVTVEKYLEPIRHFARNVIPSFTH